MKVFIYWEHLFSSYDWGKVLGGESNNDSSCFFEKPDQSGRGRDATVLHSVLYQTCREWKESY